MVVGILCPPPNDKKSEAKERMLAGVSNPTERFPEGSPRETRDELGEATGLSPRTVRETRLAGVSHDTQGRISLLPTCC